MARIDAERIARMRAAVDALPEPMRSVFRLHAQEGLDYPAVSVRLGLDVARAEALLAEAMVAIDRRLADELNSQERLGNGAKRIAARLHRCARRLGFR